MHNLSIQDLADLSSDIKKWGAALGFQAVGISNIELDNAETHLNDWLRASFHGEMDYMARHGSKRSRPDELVPGTVRVISARMDYLPPDCEDAISLLEKSELGFVSRYALGRDYHKLLRKRLQKLADQIAGRIGPYGYRVFVDSAPVLEKPLAEKAGLGWIGKHSNLLSREVGSWFFLGEIYVDLPLPEDNVKTGHCGSCVACIDACPTQAIVAPYTVDARRCISYLTIELKGSIPIEFRKPMGNRIYGCDDCQLFCPWNRFAQHTQETDFFARHQLDRLDLVEAFLWDEATFLQKTEGSAIRRIGHESWLRNIAIALGNAGTNERIISALNLRKEHPSELIREHVLWALNQHV